MPTSVRPSLFLKTMRWSFPLVVCAVLVPSWLNASGAMPSRWLVQVTSEALRRALDKGFAWRIDPALRPVDDSARPFASSQSRCQKVLEGPAIKHHMSVVSIPVA